MSTRAVSKSQTGMQGVFQVAAELTYQGFIVSVTSRNAFGADLLVTDQQCKQTWSIQVKTNHQKMGFWLLSKHAKNIKSSHHVYVFVTLQQNQRPAYHAVLSEFVASHICEEETPNGTWYSFDPSNLPPNSEGWEIFGDPGPTPEPQTDPASEISNLS